MSLLISLNRLQCPNCNTGGRRCWRCGPSSLNREFCAACPQDNNAVRFNSFPIPSAHLGPTNIHSSSFENLPPHQPGTFVCGTATTPITPFVPPPMTESSPGTPAPSARVAPEPTPEIVIHKGIVCDECNYTIHGVRHKCLDCPGELLWNIPGCF